MLLDRKDLIFGEFGWRSGGPAFARRTGQNAESAVALMPPGPTGDLRHFRGKEAALPDTVEFREAGERDMVEVEIEAHADRIGRDDVVDFARLKQLDLAISGFRTERAHYHRRTAPEPA